MFESVIDTKMLLWYQFCCETNTEWISSVLLCITHYCGFDK